MSDRIPNRSEFFEGPRSEAIALLLEYREAQVKAAGTQDGYIHEFLPLDWVERVELVLRTEGV